MLSNSIVGAAVAAAYVVVLFVQLNPQLTLQPANLGALYVALGVTYGVDLAVGFYVLIVLRQLVATEVDSPPWIAFGKLTWLWMLAAAGAAALMWLNLQAYGPMMLPEAQRRMATGAGWMSACAGLFLVLALVNYSFGRRGSRVAGGLSILTLIASLSLPLAARGFGTPVDARKRAPDAEVKVTPPADSRARVIILAIDGASLNYIDMAAAEGRLPNFGKILDGGASVHLATIRPAQPGPVWTAVATGKLPPRNGVRSAARYRVSRGEPFDLLPDLCFSHMLVRLGVVAEEPHAANALTALPVWDILSRLGISTGVVGWPLSHPVHGISGYMVSDRLRSITDLNVDPDESAQPPEAAAVARAVLETSQAQATPAPQVGLSDLANADQPTVRRALFANDTLFEQVSNEMQARIKPRVAIMRYRGLDAAGHYFLRYADPRPFGDVTAEERQTYGDVLPAAYAIVDAAVGTALASLGPDDLVLVISGFGMEPLGVGKRLLERALGNNLLSGTHENGPDGFLLAYGPAVQPGRHSRASVVDVVPTLLYFFGLPVGHDMDGYARTDLFRGSFTGARPITYIPTYEW